jgi:hypothetical protein
MVVLWIGSDLLISHINGHCHHRCILLLELLLLLVVKLVEILHLALKRIHKAVYVRLFLLAGHRSLLLKVRNYNVERVRLQSGDRWGTTATNKRISSRRQELTTWERALCLLPLKGCNSTSCKRCMALRWTRISWDCH